MEQTEHRDALVTSNKNIYINKENTNDATTAANNNCNIINIIATKFEGLIAVSEVARIIALNN